MGLDYGFVAIIPVSSLKKARDFVRDNAELGEDFRSSSCASLIFENDSSLYKYLEGGYDWIPHNSKAAIDPYILPDNRVKIGCIYITETFTVNKDPNYLSYQFYAATTNMSMLFRDSVSIKKWFIEFSKFTDAKITYLDMENEGNKIIYFNGNEINIHFANSSHMNFQKKEFMEIMNCFSDNVQQMNNE